VTVRPATPAPRPAIPAPSSRYSSATTAAAAAAAAAARARYDHDRGHDHDRGGDRDHHGDFHGRSPGSTYVRPGVPVAVNPTATGGSGRTYHAQNPALAAQVWNSRRYTDPGRWSHIDRHTSYRYYPHSHYRMNYANGYRGLGWYYGPPNYTYYYEAPYVTYYSSRSLIPSTLLSLIVGSDYGYQNSLDYEVQRALYDLGYYRGPLDGDIGPMSRLAIANYQADNGLEPTGIIDENLLYYLGIQ
jgi:N-acetylmuramoyl-L-alanine amidase